eukprot:6212469-Pleurochrysis_carterae.AAC.3
MDAATGVHKGAAVDLRAWTYSDTTRRERELQGGCMRCVVCVVELCGVEADARGRIRACERRAVACEHSAAAVSAIVENVGDVRLVELLFCKMVRACPGVRACGDVRVGREQGT